MIRKGANKTRKRPTRKLAKIVKRRSAKNLSSPKKSLKSNSQTRITPSLPRFIKDVKQTSTLIRASRAASVNAIKEAKALGLVITYMQDGILYREHPDGSRSQIAGQTKLVTKRKPGDIKLKKGMILHAKR
jgi:hypothetical protein